SADDLIHGLPEKWVPVPTSPVSALIRHCIEKSTPCLVDIVGQSIGSAIQHDTVSPRVLFGTVLDRQPPRNYSNLSFRSIRYEAHSNRATDGSCPGHGGKES